VHHHHLHSNLVNVRTLQILGLAIYNGVILDIHFPMVIYKQLLQGIEAPVTLDDLKDVRPRFINQTTHTHTTHAG
jgi:hypothetical protein